MAHLAVRGWYTGSVMKIRIIGLIFALIAIGLALLGMGTSPLLAAPPPQAVTATLPANRVEIFQDVNVRAGPSTYYDQVGVLIPGQTSAIIGRNPEGTWFEIEYVGGPNGIGWVFKDLVRVVGDLNTMPTVIPPPTPTLPPTATPQPGATQGPGTLAGTATPAANRLPTFTAPAAVAMPTLLPAQGLSGGGAFPPAVLIMVLLVLGAFGTMLSVLRLRR
jgi:hypothetical protein